ncbi:alpha/beta hydrolase family esterase [Pontivivens insulae]|uniref:Peptidase S9 prolyl oligopeptidase catalytic domain-containing protein n=1 Tax=Pontivivens insulae TaxID=1639689 RepID=A0A2R8A8V1_9RHOB|nr:prolyl oligopeptidase family serine peptidase [Pontivivens insulae]RED18751.1 poly(3-hydroxybutyrate) depolymerase [Pontivivens insulae]SPF28649.1 hypothetical protein POI8812_00951 [Pontivivens insulae]
MRLTAYLTSIALALLGTSPAALAQVPSCGAEGDPCTLSGGEYHASLPDGEISGAFVWLHGYGGRAESVVRNRGLMSAFHEHGYAVIAVQGMPRFSGDRGGSWNSLARPAPRRDDVAFIESVADDAAARFGFDRGRTMLAGFSGGGMMTWRVACDAPDAFAAYLPVAGTFWDPAPTDCGAPALLHHTHGWTDGVVPLEGRTVGSGITQGDVFAILGDMRQTMGCTSRPAEQMQDDMPYLTRAWSDCTNATAMAMTLHPGGHAIPSGWVERMDAWLDAEL